MRALITTLIISILFLTTVVGAAYAQTFKFELVNPTQTISAGKNFQVKVLINTGGVQAINGDALIVFDPAKLGINGSQTNNFFSYFSGNKLGGSNSKYLVSSWEESVAHAKSASADTLFATLDVNAAGGTGATTLSFECQAGSEADTNINQASDSKDIVKCADLKTLSLNIGAATTGTPSPTLKPSPTGTPSATLTPRPTSTPIPTNTPRPTVSVLPRSGTAEITIAALGIGALLTVFGILIIL